MSPLLPYLTIGLLLFLALVLWARQSLTAREHTELYIPASERNGHSPKDLGRRILDAYDWDFVRFHAGVDTQRMFLRERSALTISWFRRTRRQVTFAMRTHARAVRRARNVQTTRELKLLLSYLSVVFLCDLLIVLVALRGPVSAHGTVEQAFRRTARLRTALEHLITVMDAANQGAGGLALE